MIYHIQALVCFLLSTAFSVTQVNIARNKDRSSVGVAQKKLQLRKRKPPQKRTKHLPHVANTTLYDEHWAAKQERGTMESLLLSVNILLGFFHCE